MKTSKINAQITIICISVALFTSCTGTASITDVPISATAVGPTKTLTPSLTHTPTLVPTKTERPTAHKTVTRVPTEIIQVTEQAAAQQYCSQSSSVDNFLFSKSQKWMAFVCHYWQSPDFSFTRITRVNGSEDGYRLSFRKDYLEVFEPQMLSPENIGFLQVASEAASLRPVRWTADDKFLFMAFDSPIDGVQYGSSYSLMRLELESGKITPVLSPRGRYSFEFSKDGTKLFYIDQSQDPMIVKIQNLVTGELSKFSLDAKFNEAGYLTLSPDETKLIVSALSPEKGYSLILIDFSASSQNYLAQDVVYEYFPISWIDNDTLYSWSNEKPRGNYFYLNIETKQTSPAPEPTQRP